MLEEKVAIVTGASSGIGRAVALAYAKSGAAVAVADADASGGVETVERIRAAGGQAVFVQVDVTDPQACRHMVESTVAQYGRLDIACNSAGIAGDVAPTADYAPEAWQRVIAVNLSGVFYCMKYQIPQMVKAGAGAIVNLASMLGAVGFPGAPAYAASKHGVVGLTKTAALEYGGQGVRINAVGPGSIRTPMIAAMDSDPATHKRLVSLHPIGRLGEAEEVAALVLWLSSPAASFVTGGYYPVDGGYLAR